jgi:hypothetical protein
MNSKLWLLVGGWVSLATLTPVLVYAEGGKDSGDKKIEVGKPVTLFNGKDLTGWKLRGDPDKAKAKSKWVVGRCMLDEKNPSKFVVTPIAPEADGGPAARLLINASGGVDLYSEMKFGDCTVEVEFMIPKGSNSGIYLMGQYEVQVFDSFGKKTVGPGDMGGIYTVAAPKVNVCKAPGEWQTMVIDFQAPRLEYAKKVANAKFLKVVFNGEVIHENVEVAKIHTGGGLYDREAAEGPLMIQGDHGPIALKTVRVTPRLMK